MENSIRHLTLVATIISASSIASANKADECYYNPYNPDVCALENSDYALAREDQLPAVNEIATFYIANGSSKTCESVKPSDDEVFKNIDEVIARRIISEVESGNSNPFQILTSFSIDGYNSSGTFIGTLNPSHIYDINSQNLARVVYEIKSCSNNKLNEFMYTS